MRIQYIQHVKFEGPGFIRDWAWEHGFTITGTRLYEGEPLPELDEFDFLVVMGGPMGVYDEEKFPWLAGEKKFLRAAIDAGKAVLGVCLGAQLIAAVLGAKVGKNRHREIGWFPVTLLPELPVALQGVFQDNFTAFHWHGDTFNIPEGAIPFASSEACDNQAFVYGNSVVALQFHLESTAASIDQLVQHCGDELDGSRYVQSKEKIKENFIVLKKINDIMKKLLDTMVPASPA